MRRCFGSSREITQGGNDEEEGQRQSRWQSSGEGAGEEGEERFLGPGEDEEELVLK
jgi:hypothetical protein